MTVWEHFFWREVEFCNSTDRSAIEFAEVDKRILEWAKGAEYVPPKASEDGETHG